MTVTELETVGLALLPGLKYVQGRSGVKQWKRITEKTFLRSEYLQKGCGSVVFQFSNEWVWKTSVIFFTISEDTVVI